MNGSSPQNCKELQKEIENFNPSDRFTCRDQMTKVPSVAGGTNEEEAADLVNAAVQVQSGKIRCKPTAEASNQVYHCLASAEPKKQTSKIEN